MQPGTLIAGKYRVERIIGRGGMGIVVEATHLQLDTRVALKFLDEMMANDSTAVARFTREAKSCAQLKSEHVCRVTDFGIDGSRPYIALELLAGTDLARLCKVRTLDVPTVALYIKQACVGLGEAHALGIVHRDLKPGNLFVTRRADGSPLIKVLDFGVAKAPTGDDANLTGVSGVVGSPGYLSPEQFRSSKSVDARSDIWSLGIIMYKLVSGRLPFPADSFAEFVQAISAGVMPPLPEAPPAFAAIVARCLEKDPALRFADVKALADALAPFAAQARGSAPNLGEDNPPPVPEPAAKKTLLGTPAKPTASAPAAKPALDPRAQQTALGTAVGTIDSSRVFTRDVAPGTMVGEYRIESKIGEGGMGAVYAAVHPLIGKKTAIKVIHAELGTDAIVVERFVQEARSVNQIGHPNIVDVFSFGKLPDGRPYFAMELLQGENLRMRASRTFMPLADAIQIVDEIAGALEAAHEKHIVHRDLKPDNVFLAQARRQIVVKLLDFGIAKLAAADGGLSKTSTGELIGTPGYLSPEQARGKNVDHRTDIYALGVMLYELVTGRLPFMAESAMDIVMMHITEQPRRPRELVSDLPPALDQLIVQMLDKEPDRRPALVEVRHVFAELVASGAVAIEPGTGTTFRSDLARNRHQLKEHTPPHVSRTQQGSAPAPAPITRAHAPSEAPTNIAFTPGPATITPAGGSPTLVHEVTHRSRRGLVITIVLLVMLVPVVTITLGVMRRSSTPSARDAAVVTAQIGDAGAVADAAAASRDVQIHVNPPGAHIEIDGSPASPSLALADGTHTLIVSAPGYASVDKIFDVSATHTSIEVVLERAKQPVAAKPEPAKPHPAKPAAQPAKPAQPTKPTKPTVRPDAGQRPGDETIDPFK